VSDAPRPRATKKGGASRPSRASLGVVKVGDDFSKEYPDGDPRAAELYATLIRTGDSLFDEVDRAMLTTFGVNQQILNALAVIDGADEPLTPSEIGERLFKSSATMTSTLDALEQRGWIRRQPNPEDRRSLLIEITQEGRAVTDQLLPGIRRLERAILGPLNATERATFLKLLGKVLERTADVAAAPPLRLEGRRVRPARLR
jgi:DNA-binding MarR family transcriptional regulator